MASLVASSNIFFCTMLYIHPCSNCWKYNYCYTITAATTTTTTATNTAATTTALSFSCLGNIRWYLVDVVESKTWEKMVYWFRYWLNADQSTSHHPNKWHSFAIQRNAIFVLLLKQSKLMSCETCLFDVVMTWESFLHNLPFVSGIYWWPIIARFPSQNVTKEELWWVFVIKLNKLFERSPIVGDLSLYVVHVASM